VGLSFGIWNWEALSQSLCDELPEKVKERHFQRRVTELLAYAALKRRSTTNAI
jgi:hypothetical protein